MNSILNFHILISIIFCFTAAENFLPTVLKSKIRSQHRSNKSEGKLWMAYLEKRLEIMKFTFEKVELSSSLLGIYNNILRSKLFEDILTNCNKMMPEKVDELQVNIYGNICGSHVGGKIQNRTWDLCQYMKFACNLVKGKYILNILGISWLISFD